LFLANKELVEYEIQMVALQTTSVNNISRAMARVVFRRRMEFHVTNTFLQTFTLICVGYLSLFFAVDNFTDRIMVTLTTMLVVATVMSSISSSLPKTFYYKLIDWWLNFSLTMLVITMAFHTFLAGRVAAAKKQPLSMMAENSVMLQKVAWSSPTANPQHQTRMMPNINEPYMRKADLYNPPPVQHMEQEPLSEYDQLKGARRWNTCGQISYVLLVMAFNSVFWYIAIREYLRPAEEYIGSPDDPSLI
jgi:hypothetical protein